MLNSVTILIASYKRKQLLYRLLVSLRNFENAAYIKRVIVCDNDSVGQEALALINEFAPSDFPFDIIGVLEKGPGISYARNRLLQEYEKFGDCDFVALIDDDEFVSDNWLKNLIASAEKFGADVVGGPVQSIMEDPHVPTYIANSNQFRVVKLPDQIINMVSSTENVLIRSNILRLLHYPYFDIEFSKTGGEDADFFQRLKDTGALFCWSGAALVFEHIPRTRSNLKWLLVRSYRRGANTSWRVIHRKSTIIQKVKVIISPLLIIIFLLSFIASLPVSKTRSINQLCKMATSLGYLLGTLNLRVKEYHE